VSKQRISRAIRRGARYAMARAERNNPRPVQSVPAAPLVARRWRYVLGLLILAAVTAYARCGHAAAAAAAAGSTLDVVGFFGVWVILAIGVCVAAFAVCELAMAIQSILNYLFRGKD
jgi:hypothetical protein